MGWIIDVLSYILYGIGLIAIFYKTADIWVHFKSYRWGEIDKLTKILIQKIKNDNYIPDVILGIGRGGAILGAILSGNMFVPNKKRNIPILCIDRLYEWKDGKRIEIENKMLDLSSLKNKKVLLVAGDVFTGNTMKFYLDQLKRIEPMEIKTACLLKGIASIYTPDYYVEEIASEFNMPWMYKGYNYIRDSRHPFPISQDERCKYILKRVWRNLKSI